jgi:glycosyltransferase involved in cell wall biosynthesis
VRVSIVLPTYNECDNIGSLLQALRQNLESDHSLQFIVVDDSSTDRTADSALPHLDPKVDRLIRRNCLASLAGSILDGLRVAEYEQVLVMDSDFTHDPKDAAILLSVAPFCQVAIGSRFVPGGRMESQRHYRASRAYNALIRLVTGNQIRDNLGGFWTAKSSAVLDFFTATVFTGYGEYFIRLAYLLQKREVRVIEVPVIFRNRATGRSKSNFLFMALTYLKAAIVVRLTQSPR